MDNKLPKLCDTGIRVLQTLLLLSKQPMSVQEILNYFKETENEFYTNEVILKYINTLKVFGFRFLKNKNKYILLNEIQEISLDKNTLSGFLKLFEMSQDIPSSIDKLYELKEKLERKFDSETRIQAANFKFPKYKVIQNSESEKIKEFERFCDDKQKIKITYVIRKNEITLELVPLEVKYLKQYVYFSCYSTSKAQIIDIKINDIKKIEQLPNKIISDKLLLSPALFKLKDRLAKTYKLKNDENIFQVLPDGSIIVSNSSEDRYILLHRLLRYGTLCEVISPKALREDMHALITKTLNNYT